MQRGHSIALPVRGAVTQILDLPAVTRELPAVPPAELDPYLDAAARCFARHGIGRTGVPDIARELGVSRTTVYRQVGTIRELAGLLFAREIHRLLATVPAQAVGTEPVDAIVGMATLVTRFAHEHPVLRKVLVDEPELAGSYLSLGLQALIDRVRPVARPLIAAGVAGGGLAARDPDVLVDWLVRLICSVVLVPPRADLADYFEDVLRPVLAPART
jgi:AcrR family transcriptional regulator